MRLERLGFDRFAVQGLCSGAYHGFRAAQADARIGTLLLVNLPVFEWQGGASVKQMMWATASTGRLLERLMDASTWRRALTGRASVRPFVQAQGRRVVERARRWVPLIGRNGSVPERAMAGLARRGVRTLFVYSEGDPGLDMLDGAFEGGADVVRGYPGTALHVAAGVDHILSGRHMREAVIALVLNFLAADGRRSATHDHSLDHPRSDDDGRRLAEADSGAVAG